MSTPGRRPISNLDLDHVFSLLEAEWELLRRTRLLIVGGTGFFGRWLVETLVDANRRLKLNVQLILLTRDPDRWMTSMPHLATDPAITMVAGDVRSISTLAHPELHESFDYLIHAAFDSGTLAGTQSSWTVIDTLLTGTRSVLELAERSKVKRLMYVSSGAVYGRLPPTVARVPEDYSGGPSLLQPGSTYAIGKLACEMMVNAHAERCGYVGVIARGFAFIGPHLPLDVHFAAGNFIRDALSRSDITVQGDGTSQRSYLYAADMAYWLWTILFRGASGHPYNVGSGESVSIADLARLVAGLVQPPLNVRILRSAVVGAPIDRYVPDVARAATELGLKVNVSLSESFRRTYDYYRNGNDPR